MGTVKFMNNKIYKEISDWIEKYQFQIFGSLSFKEHISQSVRQKIFRHFWNRVDRHYFGSNRKNRIERM
jgi:SMC interacting uncharacterized protein involved in chromosome segregation